MPSNVVFLDTNGWVALLNEGDFLHQVATTTWRRLGQLGYRIVLTDWILAETGNTLARTAARTSFPEAVRRLLRNPQVRLMFLTRLDLEQALAMYENRADKTWGLVDCASFVVMEQEGVAEAFTTDRHFEQAGFSCLLPAAVV